MKIFAKIRFYYSAFIISFFTAVFMIPTLMLFGKSKRSIIHFMNRIILFCIGGKLTKEGEMASDVDLYVMNHQSIIDIIGLEAHKDTNIRWVAKKELFDALWFGNLLRHGGMISLDRKSKSGLKKLLQEVKQSREKLHQPVAIFPEGTRSDKQPLLKFKQGTKIIADKLKLKVQPIVITGSKWVLNEHERTAHSGTVHYRFLPVIDVSKADENWFETLRDDMQKVIDDELTNNSRCR